MRPPSLSGRRDLVFGLGGGRDAHGDPARLREAGQGVERRLRRAFAVEQLAKGLRSDIVGADQAQPGDPLGVGQRGFRHHSAFGFSLPIFGSVPDQRRRMLVQWRRIRMIDRSPAVAANFRSPETT